MIDLSDNGSNKVAFGVNSTTCSRNFSKETLGARLFLLKPLGIMYLILSISSSLSIKYWIVFQKPPSPSVSKPTTML